MAKLRLAAIATAALLMSATVSAAPLSGTFAIAGLGDVRVGTNFIDWAQAGNIFGPTPGDILYVSGSGSFSGLPLTQGTVKDLTSAADPVGVPISESNFLTSNAQPSWLFTLTFIQPGSGTAAGCTNNPGDVCTPFPTSPFTISNLVGGGSSVALAVRGTLTDPVGPASLFVGTFTTQFANLTAAEILALLSTQGFVQSSHSAEFTVTVGPQVIPEPATLLLFGTGLSLLSAGFARRRNRKRPG
jgi:hypothetical protein